MEQMYSSKWKSSSQPRKQRKYAANAPDHVKSGFMGVHLSPELRAKYGKRTVRARVGDRVKVLRGQFKGTLGKIERVDVTNQRIYVEKLERKRKDGSKAAYPIHPSNVQIVELVLSDKKRKAKLSGKSAPAAKTAPKQEK